MCTELLLASKHMRRRPTSGRGMPGPIRPVRPTATRSVRFFEASKMEQFHGTTILSVRRGNIVALGGDGQVTLGNVVMKGTARKVRKLYQGKVLVGFAGGTADAFTLLERFEGKLEKYQGNLMR